MEPGCEVRCDDRAEPQPHPDRAGADNEETAAEPQHDRNRKCRRHQAARGGVPDSLVAQPEPLVGDTAAAHAENEQCDQRQRAGILDRFRNELGRRPEGGAGIKAPGLIDRVEGEAGGQGRGHDRSQIDGHRAPAQDLQQHDQTADVGGGTGQQEDERRSRAQTLERQRRRNRCRRRGTGIERNPEDQHQDQRGDAAAPDALEQLGRYRDGGDRGEDDPKDQPIADVVEQLDKGKSDDAPGGDDRRPARILAAVGSGPRLVGVDVDVAVIADLVGNRGLAGCRICGLAPRDAEKVRGKAGGDRRHHPGDRPEHGHDRVGERVGQADAVHPGFRGGDEERDRRPRGRSELPQTQRGRQRAARAQGQRRANHRPPEDGLYPAGPDETRKQSFGHEDGERAGKQEAEDQEDRGLLQDLPDLPEHAGQKTDHLDPLRRTGRDRDQARSPTELPASPGAGRAPRRRYFCRRFTSAGIFCSRRRPPNTVGRRHSTHRCGRSPRAVRPRRTCRSRSPASTS